MGIDTEGNQQLPEDFDESVFEDEDPLREETEASIKEESSLNSGDEEVDEQDNAEADDTESETTTKDESEVDELAADSEETDDESNQDVSSKKKDSFNPKEYSKNVQKRFNKFTRENNDLKRQLAELQMRFDQQGTQQEQSKMQDEQSILSRRINNATTMAQQFMEEGEFDKANRVNSDIMDMKIRLREVQQEEQYMRERMQDPNFQYEQAAQYAPPPYIPEVQMKWMENNKRYNKDRGYTAFVDETYDALIDEGYDPDDSSLYAELDRRIGRTPPRSRRRSAAPPPNPGTQAQAQSGRRGLTSQDLQSMENWGLDPKNPTHRKEWLQNKRSVA